MKQGRFNKLQEILCDNNKIIIPDLQRDYCWGTTFSTGKKNSLAFNFASELIVESQKYIDYQEFSYGIIYTYTYPETFHYLCDGQQRLTTLYLMIGLLNCYHHDKRFVQVLQTKNKLPRLKYEVRNSTDYFIKNLVNEVFIKRDTTFLEKIKSANWFRKEYDHDPSVKSMIEAIKSINGCMVGQDYTQLTNFILDKIGFVYIDLKADNKKGEKSYSKIREYGEKMYEIVNTCGDPMEYNEHLKSVLLSKLMEDKRGWTMKWEIWQDFFWVNKSSDKESADDGFNEFLKWIGAVSEDELTIDIVENYFKAFFLIFELQEKLTGYRKFSIGNIHDDFLKNQKPKTVVLYPLLNYLFSADLVGFENNQYFVKEDIVNFDAIFRFIRFFYNLSKNPAPEKECLNFSRQLVYPQDVCNFDFSNQDDYPILTAKNEEIFKLGLFRNSNNEAVRLIVEDASWLAEDHRYLNGKIKPLLELMDVDVINTNAKNFSLTSFKIVYQHFISVMDVELNLENVRIALLAMSPNFWPYHDGGYSDGDRPRFYLAKYGDEKSWQSRVMSLTYLNLMKKIINGELIEDIIDVEIEKVEDPINKLALQYLKDIPKENWRWNHKRFFIDSENRIVILNGTKVGEYTLRIKLLNNNISENIISDNQ